MYKRVISLINTTVDGTLLNCAYIQFLYLMQQSIHDTLLIPGVKLTSHPVEFKVIQIIIRFQT